MDVVIPRSYYSPSTIEHGVKSIIKTNIIRDMIKIYVIMTIGFSRYFICFKSKYVKIRTSFKRFEKQQLLFVTHTEC